jgi:uncharacterized protein YecE (DUF72 family)
MRLFTGTSGFAYKEWKGTFYPEDIRADAMLRYYGERLTAVEINNTFYRMPKAEMLQGWAAQVPESFRFVLKASRQITHIRRLKDVADPVAYLMEQAAVLEDRLGPFLVQLPPNLKKDVPRLEAFLALIPKTRHVALDFRHESWFDDDVLDALRGGGAALCIEDAEELAAPRVATAAWGYLRLRRQDYDDADLADWSRWTAAQDWNDAYVFFKHEDAGAGPRLATQFRRAFEGRAADA